MLVVGVIYEWSTGEGRRVSSAALHRLRDVDPRNTGRLHDSGEERWSGPFRELFPFRSSQRGGEAAASKIPKRCHWMRESAFPEGGARRKTGGRWNPCRFERCSRGGTAAPARFPPPVGDTGPFRWTQAFRSHCSGFLPAFPRFFQGRGGRSMAFPPGEKRNSGGRSGTPESNISSIKQAYTLRKAVDLSIYAC